VSSGDQPRFSGDQTREAAEERGKDRLIGSAQRQVDLELGFELDELMGLSGATANEKGIVWLVNGVECRHERRWTVFFARQLVPRRGDPPPKRSIRPHPKALLGEGFCAISGNNVRTGCHV